MRTRNIKKTFFDQINTLIDWKPIQDLIDKDYKNGKSALGKLSYDGLLLFKILLLQTWYSLSDCGSRYRGIENAYTKFAYQ